MTMKAAKRNTAIQAAFQAGKSLRTIAAEHGISNVRVYQILHPEKTAARRRAKNGQRNLKASGE